MDREFKHPQIFADMLAFCQQYYPMHNNLPKPFRYAVGERILDESADCLKAIVLANTVNKKTVEGCAEGATQVRKARASIEVIRGFLLMAWTLKFVSHGAITELSARLEAISRQAARWEQWFELQRGHAASDAPGCPAAESNPVRAKAHRMR
jgi:hypothetical protein